MRSCELILVVLKIETSCQWGNLPRKWRTKFKTLLKKKQDFYEINLEKTKKQTNLTNFGNP